MPLPRVIAGRLPENALFEDGLQGGILPVGWQQRMDCYRGDGGLMIYGPKLSNDHGRFRIIIDVETECKDPQHTIGDGDVEHECSIRFYCTKSQKIKRIFGRAVHSALSESIRIDSLEDPGFWMEFAFSYI